MSSTDRAQGLPDGFGAAAQQRELANDLDRPQRKAERPSLPTWGEVYSALTMSAECIWESTPHGSLAHTLADRCNRLAIQIDEATQE